MLIDHIGWIFFLRSPNPQIYYTMRAIGRIAMPIFAFFVAQGYQYTRSKKRYILTLLFWAVISQPIFSILTSTFNFNFIFSLFLSTVCIYMTENFNKHKFLFTVVFFVIIALFIPWYPPTLDYNFYGIILVLAFYFIKPKAFSLLAGGIVLFGMGLEHILTYPGHGIYSWLYFFHLLALIPLAFYNGKKGRLNLKYLFYTFYPLHLTILYLISLYG